MSTATTTTMPETEWVPAGDVVANLNFYAPPADGSRPFNYIGTPPAGQPATNFGDDAHAVRIHDLRGREVAPSLDKEAFAFHPIPTALSYDDFGDDGKITSTYYDEIRALVRAHVADAREVLIFDHTVRRSGPLAARGPVQRVHIDQTPRSAAARLRRHFSRERADELVAAGTRFQIVNVWRPINGVVVSDPLAFADSSSVREDDLVGVAHIYPEYEGEIAAVAHNPQQQWWYVSGQTGDEVALIKCFDSRVGDAGARRRVPHSAFVHPGTPAGARGRESIEVRCLVVG